VPALSAVGKAGYQAHVLLKLAVAAHGHNDVGVVGGTDRTNDAGARGRCDLKGQFGRIQHAQHVRKIFNIKDDLLIRPIDGGVDRADVAADVLGGRLDGQCACADAIALASADFDARDV